MKPEPNDPADALVLDADLAAQIAAALTSEPEPEPEPLDDATQARIKRKLLRRIAATSTGQHLTHQPGADGWQTLGAGITIKVLHEAGGVMSYLVRLAAGAAMPAHRHPVDEECVVLEGEVQIGDLHVAAGGFHLGRQGVLHDRLCSQDGALIYLRGAVPEAALAF
jgi:quercetin dioxygenase-like cupin family protein